VSLFSLDHDRYNFASNHLLSAVQTEHQLSPSSCTAHLRRFPFPFVTHPLSRTYRLGVPLYHLQPNLPFHITSRSYRDPLQTLCVDFDLFIFNIDTGSSSYSLHFQPLPSCCFPVNINITLMSLSYQHQHYHLATGLTTLTQTLANSFVAQSLKMTYGAPPAFTAAQ
jgi:hypothetical protein